MSAFNIADEIRELGESLGLEPIGTGGGLDYMVKNLRHGGMLVLGEVDDAGSPGSLDSRCTVTYYPDGEDWSEPALVTTYPNCRIAMNRMKHTKDFKKYPVREPMIRHTNMDVETFHGSWGPDLGTKGRALEILDHGKIGDFFRGELGAPGCDDDKEWLAIAGNLITEIVEGMQTVMARNRMDRT